MTESGAWDEIGLFTTKGDLAYARVRGLILSGDLAPGTVLQQATLAGAIGMSTTPLREALRRLKQEGLVELDAHRDARVAPLEATEARDLLELRSALDPLAAFLAAQRRTEEDITVIRAALDGLEALPSHPSPQQLAGHRRFHAAVYRAAHNALLVEALDGLWDKTDRYRRHALEEGRTDEERARTSRKHRELYEAVRDSDSTQAEEVMRHHVDASLAARSAERLADAGGSAAPADQHR